MNFRKLDIPDVILCEPSIHYDKRGYFTEIFKESEFEAFIGKSVNFCQENETKSSYGVIRGLHYQLNPFAQAKLVRVTQGAVLDVVVDIRVGSKTFGKHIAIELNAENKKQIYVPPGFAHGFLVLSDYAEIIYQCTELYNPKNDKGIIWNDSSINIEWGIKTPILSKKDSKLLPLNL